MGFREALGACVFPSLVPAETKFGRLKCVKLRRRVQAKHGEEKQRRGRERRKEFFKQMEQQR